MFARIAAVCGILAVAYLLFTYQSAPQAPIIVPPEAIVADPPPPAPEFAWRQVEERIFTTYTGYFTPIPLPAHDRSKTRVRVTSEETVLFGLAADEKEFRDFLEGKASICASSSVMDVAQDCRPPARAMLFVADSRREGAIRFATLAELERVVGGKPNKVTVVVTELKCVANCAAAPQR